MLKKLMRQVFSLTFSFFVSTVIADAPIQHEGDIQPWKTVDEQVLLNATLFKADFGDLTGGLYKTNNPGFDADTMKGAFGPGNWLRFQAIGRLKFWNGSAWTLSVPNGEHLEIEDVVGETISFSPGGVVNSMGVIDQLDGNGDLHSHLEMLIKDASNQLGGSVGAYWIEMFLFETAADSAIPVSAASEPVSIIFNRGLGVTAFEAAVSAIAGGNSSCN